MKKIFLLSKVFFQKKVLLKSLLNCLLKLVIILFIIIMTLVPIINYQFATDGYQYGTYDVKVSDCSEYTFNKLENDPNVTSIIGISGPLLGSSISKGNKHVTGRAVAVYDDNFNMLRKTVLADELFIKKNEKLMGHENAMLLSYSFMLNLNADIGDVITLDAQDDDQNLKYVLAGVFKESVSWTSMGGTSIIVLGAAHDGALLDFMDDILKSRLYGTVYLNFKDKQAGVSNINANYYRDFNLYRKYGENYLEEASDDELQAAKSDALDRAELLRVQQLSFKYSESPYQKSYAYFFIPIGMAMICLLTIQENNKKIQLGLKSIAILCITGVSKLYIFFSFLFDSFIKMSLLQVLAIYIFQIIHIKQEMYPPADLLLRYTVLYILSILIASAISAFISVKKIGEEEIMATLNDEDIQEDLL